MRALALAAATLLACTPMSSTEPTDSTPPAGGAQPPAATQPSSPTDDGSAQPPSPAAPDNPTEPSTPAQPDPAGGTGEGGGSYSGPMLSSFWPGAMTAGSPAFTLTVTGERFTADTTISLGGAPLTTTYVDATTLTALVPPQATADAATLTVATSNPAGMATSGTPFVVSGTGPLVSHATPAAASVGLFSVTVTLVGTGFHPFTSVSMREDPHHTWSFQTTYLDATHLSVQLPGSILTTTGTLTLDVVNPDGMQTQFSYAVVPPPVPVVTGVDPGLATLGAAGFSTTILGEGFVPATTASFGGASLRTVFWDQHTLFVDVPAAALTAVGPVDLAVTTPAPGGGTAVASFTVGWPVPTVHHVDPAAVVYGNAGLTAAIVGSVFAPGATVSWGGQALPTTYVDATTLRAVLPAAALASPGTLELDVTNPAPGGGTAKATLSVKPAPVLDALVPPEGHVGSQITLSGSNFGSAGTGGSVTIGGLPVGIVSWSDNSIVATIPSGAQAGPVRVESGAAASATRPFTVTATVSGQLVDGSPNASLDGNWAHAAGRGARLIVTAAGTGRSVVTTPSRYSGFPQSFSLELPLGIYTFAVEELDDQGNASIDLFQAASRQLPDVVVGENGVAGLSFPVRWHWELQVLDPGFNVCGFEKQLHFRDAEHGYVTFQVDADADPSVPGRIHGAIMSTSDGGRTWSLLNRDISSGWADFRPLDGAWFSGGHLLALGDGATLLSIGQNGALVRSADAGATWHRSELNWQNIGPGGASPTRFARSGGALFVTVGSGGVQGSCPRENLLVSTDDGATWNVKYDVCASNWYGVVCPNQAPYGFAGMDVACSDVDGRRCIAMGNRDSTNSTVLVTEDGFDTSHAIAPSCGVFTGVVEAMWVPGTLTAHVVADSSCVNVPRQHMVTHDGGDTWSDWGSSPFSGRTAFVDASNVVTWWDSGVFRSSDGGASWRYTGHAPSASGALRTVQVLDSDHMWVLGNPDCRESGAAYVARWVP